MLLAGVIETLTVGALRATSGALTDPLGLDVIAFGTGRVVMIDVAMVRLDRVKRSYGRHKPFFPSRMAASDGFRLREAFRTASVRNTAPAFPESGRGHRGRETAPGSAGKTVMTSP